MCAYDIKKYGGASALTIADGDADISTPLSFLGQGYVPYGQIMDTNLLRLLEHSASSMPLTNPVMGQLWFDISENALKICTDPVNKTWSRCRLKSDPAIITPPPSSPTSTFDITDKIIEGQTIYLDVSSIQDLVNDPTIKVNITWHNGADTVVYSQTSTGTPFTVLYGSAGNDISVSISYTNKLGNIIAVSSKIKKVAAGPSISVSMSPSTINVGTVVTASTSIVNPVSPVSGVTVLLSYTWYLDNIPVYASTGPSDNTYTIPANSVGKKLNFTANFKNDLIPSGTKAGPIVSIT
jgi:hypothetical protein